MSIGEASLFYSLLYSWYGMSTVASWSDALLYSSGLLDGVDGNEALLVRDGAFRSMGCRVHRGSPPLEKCDFAGAQFPMEPDLSDFPTSVLVVEDHHVVGMNGATFGKLRTRSNQGGPSTKSRRTPSCCLVAFLGFTSWQLSGNRPGSFRVMISMATTCCIKWLSKAVVFCKLVASLPIVLCFRSVVNVDGNVP